MQYISVAEARKNFAQVINEVAYGGLRCTVQRRGKDLVTLIGAADYQALLDLLSETGADSEIHGVLVNIRFEGDRFSVSDQRFGVQGQGATLAQARRNYWLSLQDHYARLQAGDHELPHHASADQLALLARVLAEADDREG
jgi:prevent-host-death family protein